MESCIQVLITLIIDVLTPDTNQTLKPKREVLEDEEKDMYATEYKKAFVSIVNPPELQPVISDKRVTRRIAKSRSRSRTRGKSKERKVEEENKPEVVVQDVEKKIVKKELNEDINKEQEKVAKAKNSKTITEKRSTFKEAKPLQEHAKTVKKTESKREQGTKKKVTWAKQVNEEKGKPYKTIVSTSKAEGKALSKSIPT